MLRNLLFHQAHVLNFSSNHMSIVISEIGYCASECAIKKRDLIFLGSLSGERTIKQKDSEHIDVSRILPFTVSRREESSRPPHTLSVTKRHQLLLSVSTLVWGSLSNKCIRSF